MNTSNVLQPKFTNSTTSTHLPRLTLELSPTVFTAAWIFIVIFHTACTTFLICVAVTYWFLTTGTMPFYVSDYSLTGTQNYHFYGFMFGLVGGIHGVRVIHIIVLSIRSRQLTLQSETSTIPNFVITRMMTSRSGKSRDPLNQPLSPISRVGHTWNTFFSRKGIFGVESEHFSTVFAIREVLEATSQTYQAYRASILLPRAELNSLIVGLLIANCWSTAGTEYFLCRSPALERVATLTYDALISFGIMTIVPLMVFIPYVEGFDIPNKLFKNADFLYDPVAITKLVLENRLIFSSGLLDFSTKLIPQLSIILSLITVSELLSRGEARVIPVAQRIESVPVKSKVISAEAEVPNVSKKIHLDSQYPAQWASFRAFRKWKDVIAIAVFIIWGSIVLLLHSMAAYRAANYDVVGCRAETRPWFSNGKEPCSSLVYDCQALNTVSPNTSSFDKMDSAALSTLAIVHCPELHMPPDIQRFSNLVMIQIYNSTIVRWDADSAISATTHAHLLSVLVGKTNMTEFPEGLLQPLPVTMMSVQFSETNLSRLPDDLYLRWHFLVAVVFENSLLTEIPYQTFFMPVYILSFMGNRIESVPTLAMMPPGMIIPELRLESNPLTELPAALMDPTAMIMSLNIQNTSVTNIPEWVKAQTMVVWANETPFCAGPMTDSTLASKVMCVHRPPGSDNLFPMHLFEELYPFHTVDKQIQEV
ncbi:hypothetical protein PHMEG_0002742 [Phytophthora megakarya]|uniref:Uncharacterized protein n=1 Tax=Phytophthora megakarya TaxID=4795 RepID=A0A225X039_9STRA|nr:hypothetical protein PHMEG_0002742 [Phytophthora megakarya]